MTFMHDMVDINAEVPPQIDTLYHGLKQGHAKLKYLR